MYAVISYVRHCIDQYVLLILAVHGDQENQYGFLRLESKGQHAIKCLMNANLQVQKSFYKAITWFATFNKWYLPNTRKAVKFNVYIELLNLSEWSVADLSIPE